MCRQQAGRHADDAERQRGAGQYRWMYGRHAEEHALQGQAGDPRPDDAQRGAAHQQRQCGPHEGASHLARPRAQRHRSMLRETSEARAKVQRSKWKAPLAIVTSLNGIGVAPLITMIQAPHCS